MTDIPALATSPTRAAGGAAGRLLSSDFDTFLRMLTAQIQNQNPLEPMPSSDFAVQLATFSSVEQQIRTNQLLQALTTQGAGGLAEAARWVGMEVRAPAPALFDGAPLPIRVVPAAGADAAQVVVRDGLGREIERLAIDPRPATLTWDGRTSEGTPHLAGPYSFEVVSFAAGVPLASSLAETYGRVVEVRAGDGGPTVVLEGGFEVSADAISALRAPEADR